MLLVRPAAGAWGATVVDGGALDSKPEVDGALELGLGALTPLTQAPPPSELLAGDVLVVLDPNTLSHLAAAVTGELLEPGGGRVIMRPLSMPRKVVPCLLATLFSATAVQAQDFPGIARGFEPEKSYQIGEIESVGLFNGGLTFTIPIGGTYPIGPSFGLGLTLVYNSHLWRYQESGGTTQLWPSEIFNAGLGWTLSLGRLLHPQDLTNDGAGYTYYDASGARHDFYTKLHASDSANPPPDPSYLYSRDGSYLRLITGSAPVVQFPDGSEHVFERVGTSEPAVYRLLSMKDAFNNSVSLTYPSTATTQSWLISSPATFDTLEVVFDTTPAEAGHYATKGGVVKQIHFKATPAPGNTTPRTASYAFSYEKATFIPGQGCGSQSSPQVTVPFLTQVELPGGATWQMPWSSAYVTTNSGGCAGNPIGLIQKLTLPTQGKFEWTWGSFTFPQPAERCKDSLANQVGLAARRHYDRNGSSPRELELRPGARSPLRGLQPHESAARPTAPLEGDGDLAPGGRDRALLRRRHQPGAHARGALRLPAARMGGLGRPGRRICRPRSTTESRNLMRTTYVRYEWDGGAGGATEQPPRANQRVCLHEHRLP